MDMRDKEFDELFRAKLDGFETEPSARVWPEIAEGLESAKRRKSLAPWLSIAAGIIVLIGVGLFFIPKKINTETHVPVKNGIAKTHQPENTNHSQAVQARQPSPVNVKPVKSKVNVEFAHVKNDRSGGGLPVNHTDTAAARPEILTSNDRQMIASVPQKPVVAKPVVPDPAVQLAIKSAVDANMDFTKPDQTGTRAVADVKKDTAIVKRRHKIHNFGDLVNLVVDKLDKRQDKVIHFVDDDEGDSHLTAVNLGVVKIKKGE